jgi:enamine deaminase RidA (YjgF/YER057c/UK114 family)
MSPAPTAVRRLNVEARYSDVAIHNGVAWLAGQVPDTPDADMQTQTQQVLATIDRLLGEAGTHRGRLLMATIYLADMADYGVLNEVWDAWVADVQAPPRATVEARLAKPGWKVEIVVTAALS